MITFAKLILDVIAILVMMCILAEKFPTKNTTRLVIAAILVCVGGLIPLKILDGASSESSSIIIEGLLIIITALIVYALVELPLKEYFIYYIISTLITNVIEPFLKILLQDYFQGIIAIKICTILVITFFSFLVLVVFKKKINFVELAKKNMIVIGVMFFATMALFSTIAVYLRTTRTNYDIVIVIIVVFVCLTVFGVALEVVILEISKNNLQRENGMLQNYNEQQQQYYELLLKKEEDTRRYRHDMLNHMICINDLLDAGDIDEVKDYLSNITSDLSSVRKDLYHTGNRIADVIMTNIFQNKSEDTKITVVGQLNPEMGISDYDLCIVLSNILKNSVEAVNRQGNSRDKYIKVKFAVGKRFLRIEEWNSIDAEQVKNAQKLETSKNDKHRHGLGTKNIKLMVEKYDGKFTTEVKDNEFHICVDLDLKRGK